MAGRRIRLPGPASPPAEELSPRSEPDRRRAPGLLLGGRMDLAEITGLTLAAIVPGFAEGAGVFVLEHLLKGGEPVGQAIGGEVVTRRLGTTFARAGQRVSREAFPPGQVIAFAPSSPYARCMDTGGPVVFAEPDGPTLERLRPDGREVVSGCSSFLAVPLTARDTVVGMLAFARDPGAPAFSRARHRDRRPAGGPGRNGDRQRADADAAPVDRRRAAARPAGRRAAGALRAGDRRAVPAGRGSRHRRRLVRHHPAGRRPDRPRRRRRHGPRAGGRRGDGPAARRRPRPGRPGPRARRPAAAAEPRDRDVAAASRSPPAPTRWSTRTVTPAPWPGPVTCRPSWPCPTAPPGSPNCPRASRWGSARPVYGQARIKLPPGAVLALYTDGLVESRTRSFDQGILAMRSILAREHGHLEATCDALIDVARRALRRRHHGDPGPDPGRPARLTEPRPAASCITGTRAPSGSATPPHGWFRRAQE